MPPWMWEIVSFTLGNNRKPKINTRQPQHLMRFYMSKYFRKIGMSDILVGNQYDENQFFVKKENLHRQCKLANLPVNNLLQPHWNMINRIFMLCLKKLIKMVAPDKFIMGGGGQLLR